jgi:hypothetical protein
MTKAEFEALKAKAREIREKSADMDIIVAQLMKLPYGQLKKVLTDEVLAVLTKYGYGEE